MWCEINCHSCHDSARLRHRLCTAHEHATCRSELAATPDLPSRAPQSKNNLQTRNTGPIHHFHDNCITLVLIGPILQGHSGPLCHALSLLLLLSMLSLWTSILHCHSPGVATVARRLRYSYSWLRLILEVVSTVATPGEWQCKIRTGGVRRLAVANGPNIFQMLLV